MTRDKTASLNSPNEIDPDFPANTSKNVFELVFDHWDGSSINPRFYLFLRTHPMSRVSFEFDAGFWSPENGALWIFTKFEQTRWRVFGAGNSSWWAQPKSNAGKIRLKVKGGSQWPKESLEWPSVLRARVTGEIPGYASWFVLNNKLCQTWNISAVNDDGKLYYSPISYSSPQALC